jgi:hypothetical protein
VATPKILELPPLGRAPQSAPAILARPKATSERIVGYDSSCSRPASRHNFFLQRSPSFSATACNRPVRMRGRVVTHHPQFGNGIKFLEFEDDGKKVLAQYLDAINAYVA